jgi:hypothetical protein
VGFQRRGVIPEKRHLGCFDDHAGAVAAYSSYSSLTKEERKARNNSQYTTDNSLANRQQATANIQ